VNPYKLPLPVIPIGRGEKRAIDFYYRLPANAESNDEVPAFELLWTIETGKRQVAERTSFDRLRVDAAYASNGYYYGGPGYYPGYGYGYGPGWGPYGWYGPYGHFGNGVYLGRGGHFGHGFGGGHWGGGGHFGGGHVPASPSIRR
jgi:hypothetical protein